MNIKVKALHPLAKLPARMHATDAGADLYVVEEPFIDRSNNCWIYRTGLAFEIPAGYYGDITNRSSIYKTSARLHRGIVDASYRGEVKLVFSPVVGSVNSEHPPYAIGERMAQLIITPCDLSTFEFAEELSDSDRSTGGFGSTGR